MKKTIIICTAAVIIGILLTFTTVRAAGGSDVVFEGYSKNFIDIPHSNYLFGNFKNLYPGVSVSKKISVHNPDKRNVRVYLRARAVSSEYIYLLQNISVSVTDSDGNVISASPNPAQNMLVCELSGGESREVKIRLDIDKQNDISIISTFKKLDFIFSSEEFAGSSESNIPDTDGSYNFIIFPVSGIAIISSVIIILSVRKKYYF